MTVLEVWSLLKSSKALWEARLVYCISFQQLAQEQLSISPSAAMVDSFVSGNLQSLRTKVGMDPFLQISEIQAQITGCYFSPARYKENTIFVTTFLVDAGPPFVLRWYQGTCRDNSIPLFISLFHAQFEIETFIEIFKSYFIHGHNEKVIMIA